jgi:hypothetical protein
MTNYLESFKQRFKGVAGGSISHVNNKNKTILAVIFAEKDN